MGKFVFKRAESIVGKGKKYGNKYFFSSHNVFEILESKGRLNSRIV